MSRKFLTPIDLTQLELLNARIQNLASAPGTPVSGQIYFDTVLNKFRVYAGAPISNWVNLDGSDIPDGAITSAKIANGTILNEDINASAAIALSKLATDPLARANHTGSQTVSTLSDFASASLEISQDAVGAVIGAGGVVVTYDDAGTGLTTITFTNNEAMQDVIGAFLPSAAGSTGITVTYDDAGGKINYVVTDAPLLGGQNSAYYLARANHTGTQTASTVSDFDTQVRTSRLDQMAVPTASLNLNSQLITNLLEPVNPQDAATRNYVDLARQGIHLKIPVKAATIGPITLSGPQTVDGVALIADDRVLVKDQAAAQNNGLYLVKAGAFVRTTDADTAAELNDGATVFVQQGTTNANFVFAQINTVVTLGTDVQSWVQQGAATNYLGGNGIDLTGLTFDVVAGNGIIADGTSTRVDPAVVARKYNTTVGDGAALSYVKTHGLSNQWVNAQVFRNSAPFDLIDCDVELTDANNVTLRFTVAPTSAQHRLVVSG